MGQFAKREVIGRHRWVSCATYSWLHIAHSGKVVTVRVRVQREPKQQAPGSRGEACVVPVGLGARVLLRSQDRIVILTLHTTWISSSEVFSKLSVLFFPRIYCSL